jgi:hypothetical protein
MKKIVTLTALIIILLSFAKCSNDNSGYTNNHPELLATWKYVELIGFDYNCPTCGPYLITDGFTITFNKNGTFTSNEMVDYPKGRYVVSSSDEITLTYRSATLNPITKVKRISSLSNNGLILEPIPICDEGCSERYEKVTTP